MPNILTQVRHKTRLVNLVNGVPVTKIRGVPVLLVEGELPDEEDNAFFRWVHRARRLSSMVALRASADKADVRHERNIRYDYAKSKARGRLWAAIRPRYAPAVPVAASPYQASAMDPPAAPITGEKRPRLQVDPDRGA